MKITPEEVANIAKLARLSLPEEKLSPLAGQFTDILQYMDLLGQADTENVAPLYTPVEQPARMREDEAASECEREAVLGNAPESDGNYFIVPKTV